MNMETIMPEGGQNRMYLSSEQLLKFLIGKDETVDTLIICGKEGTSLFTTDLALHEAFGSIKPYDNVKTNRIAKLFENVDVESFRKAAKMGKPVLTHERVEELRSVALKNKNDNRGG